ncbi:hypothetical protein [Stomatohabitans albus]
MVLLDGLFSDMKVYAVAARIALVLGYSEPRTERALARLARGAG